MLSFILMCCGMLAVAFVFGYMIGAYRQREYIKRRVRHGFWDWLE